jgi:hypothetical protein
MGKHSRQSGSGVWREILSGLPGRHRHTGLPEPELLSPDEFHEISTGENNPQSLGSLGHLIVGLLFWLGWLSWGVYTWWFVDRTLFDFVIATVLWTLTFTFTVLGVPLVRVVSRRR